MVTMATTPKSAGVSSRARTTVGTTCSASDSAWADTVAAAPRTARRRNSLPSATGWNAPLASNGDMSRAINLGQSVAWCIAWHMPVSRRSRPRRRWPARSARCF